MKILITGANSFIGKTLCKKILANDWQVYGTIRSDKDAAVLPPGVKVVLIKSIDQATDWSSVLNGIDVVIHLAGRVHVLNDPAAEIGRAHV